MQSQKLFYGYTAGLISAILLQPLQNIKMFLMIPPSEIKLSNNFLTNIKSSISYLSGDEGVRSFYKGLTANIIRSSISSSIFFGVLRFSEKINENVIKSKNIVVVNFVSSMTARVVSAVVSNPFLIIETRYELAGKERWSGAIASSFSKLYKNEGFNGFFKGLLPTCYKEGFFAGMYYALYEQCKKLGMNFFVSGMLSGIISTTITHPLEIIRAEVQVATTSSKIKMRNHVVTLARSGQILKGLAPKLIKKPLANTIAFGAFQIMENMQKQVN